MKQDPKSNLRPYMPGDQRKRPSGPRRPLSDAYTAALELSAEDLARPLPPGSTVADAIAYAIAKKAARGGVLAAQELGDRVEGKPGTIGGGPAGIVSLLLLMPDRETELDALPEALSASREAVRGALEADARALPPAVPDGADGEAEADGQVDPLEAL